MRFSLEERPPGWSEHAPIRIRHELNLPAPPERVFAVLANVSGWARWFKGMRRVRIDGPAAGVGTLRTVWVGASQVQERFIVWDPWERITLQLVSSNIPGLRTMMEDYQISPAPGGSTLSITVGIEARGPLQHVPALVRFLAGRPASGVLGIKSAFS